MAYLETLPSIGFGTYKIITLDSMKQAVKEAYEIGYRLIDTATYYNNEALISQALDTLKIKRTNLFLCSKVWKDDMGYFETLKAFEKSCENLATSYLDIYFIHWPSDDDSKTIATYQALEKLYKEGKIRAIGVSNFSMKHLELIRKNCTVTPLVNQIEYSPLKQDKALLNYCHQHNIIIQAWRPLGGGELLKHPVIEGLAKKYHCSPAQIALKWQLEIGNCFIAKASNFKRLKENFSLDFKLSQDDVHALSTLNLEDRV